MSADQNLAARTPSDDLPVAELIAAAAAASRHAYVPYSDFRTGAAVLTADGEIHVGALVENLVFGVAMCAERVALFSAVVAGPSRAVALALAAPSTAGRLTQPCGPCLQVAVELGGPEMIVISAPVEGGDRRHEITTVGELAPGIPRRNRLLR